MHVEPFRSRLATYLVKRGLTRKFDKQLSLFLVNFRHPSLNTEQLEPKELRIYSFRLDKKYRVIFIRKVGDIVEIIDINDYYQ